MSKIISNSINSLVKTIAKAEEYFKDKGTQYSIIILLLIKEFLLTKFFINSDPIPQIYVFIILLSVFFLTIVANPLLSILKISDKISIFLKLLVFVGLFIYGITYALKLKKDNDKFDINQNKYDLNSLTFFFILISMGTYLFFNIFKNLSLFSHDNFNDKSLNSIVLFINITLLLVLFFNNLPKKPKTSNNEYDTQNKNYIYSISLIFMISIFASLGFNVLKNNREYLLSYGLMSLTGIILLAFAGMASFSYFNNVKDDYQNLIKNNLKLLSTNMKDNLLGLKNNNAFTSGLLLFIYIILSFTTYSSFGLIAKSKPLLVLGLIGLIFSHFLWVLSGSYSQDLLNNNKRNIYTNELVNDNKYMTTIIAASVITIIFTIITLVSNKNIIKINKIKTVLGLVFLIFSFYTARNTGSFISKTNNLIKEDDPFVSNISKLNTIFKENTNKVYKKINNNSEFNTLKMHLKEIFEEFNIKVPIQYTFLPTDKISIKITNTENNNLLTTFDYIFKSQYPTFTGLINDINNQMLLKYKSKSDDYIININLCFKDDTTVLSTPKRYFTILIKNILKKENSKEYKLLDLDKLKVDIECTKNVNDFFVFKPQNTNNTNNTNDTIQILTNKIKYNDNNKYLPILGNAEIIKENTILQNLTYITTSNRFNIDKLNPFFDDANNLRTNDKVDINIVKVCSQYAEKQVLNFDILCDLIVNVDDNQNQTLNWSSDSNAVDFYTKYNEDISTPSNNVLKANVNGNTDYFKNHINNFLKEYTNYIYNNLFKIQNPTNINVTQIISRTIDNNSINNNTELLLENSVNDNIKTYIQNPNMFMDVNYYINKAEQVYKYINLNNTNEFINIYGNIDIKDGTEENKKFNDYVNTLKERLDRYENLNYEYKMETGKTTTLCSNNMFYKSNDVLGFIVNLNIEGYKNVKNANLDELIKEKGTFTYSYFSFLSLFIGILVISFITFKYDIIYDKFFVGGLNKNNIFNNIFGTIILILLGLSAIEWKFSKATNSMSKKQTISNVLNVLISSLYMFSLMIPGYIKKILIFLVAIVLHSSLFTLPSSIFENTGVSSSFLYMAIVLILILSVNQLINPITSKYKFMYIILGALTVFMLLNSFPISMFKNNDFSEDILNDVKEAGNRTWPVLVVAIVVGLLIFKYLFNPYRLNAIRFKQSKDVLFAKELIK